MKIWKVGWECRFRWQGGDKDLGGRVIEYWWKGGVNIGGGIGGG